MEGKELILSKPSFDEDISAQIKSVGEITSNIAQVKIFANNLKDYYSNINFSEDTLKLAKDEKSNINKFKTKISEYRKDIVKQFNEPIKQFEELAKETENVLKETYELINQQVNHFEDIQKEEILTEMKDFFDEYKMVTGITFILFEEVGLKINLSASKKSMKEAITAFVDKRASDIEIINLQPNSEEILVEYKSNGYDLNKAISTVMNRIEMIKREAEIKAQQKVEREEVINNLNKFIEAPVEEVIEVKEVELLTTTFTIEGTLEQLKDLKEYIKNNGMRII